MKESADHSVEIKKHQKETFTLLKSTNNCLDFYFHE